MSFRIGFPGWCFGLLASLAGGVAGAQFTAPLRAERVAAVGSLSGLNPALRRAFTDGGEYQAKRPPAPSDWLGAHTELGQTFAEYLASRPNLPGGLRTKLHILPLGTFEQGKAPALSLLRAYMAAYFHPLPVEILPAVADKDVKTTSRVNSFTAEKQWKTLDILAWMHGRLPPDSYAMIAVTMTDLYPDETWNFVFGQASIKERVGVFSFARYSPAWDEGIPRAEIEALVLRRAAKVLTHEMAHMFGIRHCIYHECNMNGANHLQEADSTPMALCPVCLRKLLHATKGDPVKRYAELTAFYQRNGLGKEAAWTSARKKAIEEAR